MPEWTRNSPWRQGDILSKEAVEAIGFYHPANHDDTVVIVATHDCDLAQSPEKEPNVELIIGRQIKSLDGNCTHAKSSRTIHLEFDGALCFAEFVITDKCAINKQDLAAFSPNKAIKLSKANLATFQIWLASRYRRSAFPDEFENRMKISGLAKKIAKVVKKDGEQITALFFDVSEDPTPQVETSSIYLLGIVIAYNPDMDTSETAAETVKSTIKEIYDNLCSSTNGTCHGIDLQYIDVISEEALSYRQTRELRKWRLDHLSLEADPQQPTL